MRFRSTDEALDKLQQAQTRQKTGRGYMPNPHDPQRDYDQYVITEATEFLTLESDYRR